ncbi:GntR family transcriptional regulator, partial [Nocardia paucivorans]|uniref:GntR family transcriptional regulator n=1 Tax=Nocardia paucivorans TaxID=114259 RepID=UPI0012F71D6A
MSGAVVPGIPEELTHWIIGHSPVGSASGMREVADALHRSGVRLAETVSALELGAHDVVAAIEGATGTAVRETLGRQIDYGHVQVAALKSLAGLMREAANVIELEQLTVRAIGIAMLVSIGASLGTQSLTARLNAEIAVGQARRRTLAWLWQRFVAFRAEFPLLAPAVSGMLVGAVSMGGASAAAQYVQIEKGRGEVGRVSEMDWGRVGVAAVAGSVGGASGAVTAVRVMPWLDRRVVGVGLPLPVVWAVVGTGGVSGAVGGLAGGLTAFGLTDEEVGGRQLVEMVLMGIGGGAVGGLGAAVQVGRVVSGVHVSVVDKGVGEPGRSRGESVASGEIDSAAGKSDGSAARSELSADSIRAGDDIADETAHPDGPGAVAGEPTGSHGGTGDGDGYTARLGLSPELVQLGNEIAGEVARNPRLDDVAPQASPLLEFTAEHAADPPAGRGRFQEIELPQWQQMADAQALRLLAGMQGGTDTPPGVVPPDAVPPSSSSPSSGGAPSSPGRGPADAAWSKVFEQVRAGTVGADSPVSAAGAPQRSGSGTGLPPAAATGGGEAGAARMALAGTVVTVGSGAEAGSVAGQGFQPGPSMNLNGPMPNTGAPETHVAALNDFGAGGTTSNATAQPTIAAGDGISVGTPGPRGSRRGGGPAELPPADDAFSLLEPGFSDDSAPQHIGASNGQSATTSGRDAPATPTTTGRVPGGRPPAAEQVSAASAPSPAANSTPAPIPEPKGQSVPTTAASNQHGAPPGNGVTAAPVGTDNPAASAVAPFAESTSTDPIPTGATPSGAISTGSTSAPSVSEPALESVMPIAAAAAPVVAAMGSLEAPEHTAETDPASKGDDLPVARSNTTSPISAVDPTDTSPSDDELPTPPEEFPGPLPADATPRVPLTHPDPHRAPEYPTTADHPPQWRQPRGTDVVFPGAPATPEGPPPHAIPVIPHHEDPGIPTERDAGPVPYIPPIPADPLGSTDTDDNTPRHTPVPDVSPPPRHRAAPETHLPATGKSPEEVPASARYATEPDPETLGAPQDSTQTPQFHPDVLDYIVDSSGVPRLGGLPATELAPQQRDLVEPSLPVPMMGLPNEDDRTPRRRTKKTPEPPPKPEARPKPSERPGDPPGTTGAPRAELLGFEELRAALVAALEAARPPNPLRVLAEARPQQVVDALAVLTTQERTALLAMRSGQFAGPVSRKTVEETAVHAANRLVKALVEGWKQSDPPLGALRRARPEQVRYALDELAPQQRRTIVGLLQRGESAAVVAQELGLGVPMVERLAQGAIRRLAERIAAYHAAGAPSAPEGPVRPSDPAPTETVVVAEPTRRAGFYRGQRLAREEAEAAAAEHASPGPVIDPNMLLHQVLHRLNRLFPVPARSSEEPRAPQTTYSAAPWRGHVPAVRAPKPRRARPIGTTGVKRSSTFPSSGRAGIEPGQRRPRPEPAVGPDRPAHEVDDRENPVSATPPDTVLTVSSREVAEIEAELRRYPGSDYLVHRPETAPDEPIGAAWIDSPQRYAWERAWLTANSPRISALAALTLAALEAETEFGLPNTTPGPYLIVQQRPRLPGEILPVWKFRTLPIGEPERPSDTDTDTASQASTIGRPSRALSLDEILQYAYCSLVGARPVFEEDLELTRQVLSLIERPRFALVPRDGVYTAHYPLSRFQTNQSSEFLRTRYLADRFLLAIGSRTFYQHYLDNVVTPYQRREAHRLLDGYTGRDLSAAERVGHWFVAAVTAILDAEPEVAPRILHEALDSPLRRTESAFARDGLVRSFVAKIAELLDGHTDFGSYLHHRQLPETQEYLRDVRQAVRGRHPHEAAMQVPFLATLLESPAAARTDASASRAEQPPAAEKRPVSESAHGPTPWKKTEKSAHAPKQRTAGPGKGAKPNHAPDPFDHFDHAEALDLPARARARRHGPDMNLALGFHHDEHGREWDGGKAPRRRDDAATPATAPETGRANAENAGSAPKVAVPPEQIFRQAQVVVARLVERGAIDLDTAQQRQLARDITDDTLAAAARLPATKPGQNMGREIADIARRITQAHVRTEQIRRRVLDALPEELRVGPQGQALRLLPRHELRQRLRDLAAAHPAQYRSLLDADNQLAALHMPRAALAIARIPREEITEDEQEEIIEDAIADVVSATQDEALSAIIGGSTVADFTNLAALYGPRKTLSFLIARALHAGGFEKGHRLPSALELALHLGISHRTVIRVYETLGRQGYVTVSKRGTSVADERQWPESPKAPASSDLFAEELATRLMERATSGEPSKTISYYGRRPAFAAALRRELEEGWLENGGRLPPAEKLAKALGISRWSVQQIYKELAEEGHLPARQRSITAVTSKVVRSTSADVSRPEKWSPPVELRFTPEEFVRRIAGSPTPESFVRLVERNDWQTVLVTMLHRALLDGAFEAGDRLPLSSELGEYLGVSKQTVVLAYRALSEAGYLVTVSG